MKKKIIILIILLLSSTLVGCSSSNKYVGTWKGDTVAEGGSVYGSLTAYKGTEIKIKLSLYEGGTGAFAFELPDFKNPFKYDIQWKVDGKKIRTTSSEGVVTDFKISSDTILMSVDGLFELVKKD